MAETVLKSSVTTSPVYKSSGEQRVWPAATVAWGDSTGDWVSPGQVKTAVTKSSITKSAITKS